MKIELLGTSFTLQSDEDPEYLDELVRYVAGKISEIKSTVSTRDNLKIAILAAVLLADELFKEREHRNNREAGDDRTADEVNRIADALIARIDTTLGEAQTS